MKLLLTSNGLSNKSLRDALRRLVKDPIRIAFIPTAANIVEEEKSWLINDLNNCQKVGVVDIVDISAVPKSVWLPRLKSANAIAVGGGDSRHLLKCIVSSGLKNELYRLLKNRIYVGISAGSIVVCKTLQTSSDFIFGNKKAPRGLCYVPFFIRPHLNSLKFPKYTEENFRKVIGRIDGDVYLIDDDSAVLVEGNRIEVISKGMWKFYKKK